MKTNLAEKAAVAKSNLIAANKIITRLNRILPDGTQDKANSVSTLEVDDINHALLLISRAQNCLVIMSKEMLGEY